MTKKGGTISPDAAEHQLDILIERRAQQARDANWRAKAWSESLRSYNLKAASARRRAWVLFHRRLQVLHSRLSDEHRHKADALLEADGAAPQANGSA